ncbi:MAG: hypothetical protein ONB30_00160 [candidate division KSB1 bacterium]|nr:hypothetical protein [candidate division KSB1 bacterium]
MSLSANRLTCFVANRLVALSAGISQVVGYPINVAWLLRRVGILAGKKVRFYGESIGRDIVIADDVLVAEGVRISSSVVLHKGAQVHKDTTLGQGVIIKEHSIVCARCILERISLGGYSMICSEVLCLGHGKGQIKIGSHSYIGPRCLLDWSDDLLIGDFVHVSGPCTAFWTHSSVYQALHGDPLDERRRRTTAPLIIENNVYIGGNCTIYPGLRIGHHSIILPNSAVNQDVPSWCMVGGVPARIIRRLDPEMESEDEGEGASADHV